MDPPSRAAPPATLGKYEVRGVLGRGAMGTVYDGWDPRIGRRVAIKTVRMLEDGDPDAREALARFQREAQAAGRLSHPNIVGVYDYGETGESAYIVMEFVEGHSLKERLDARDPFPVAETVRIMEQLLAGLQFSHDGGVVHRDIKPGNVMLAKDGRVKIADFGIARVESSVMTQDGTMLGTPAYMSPEQLMAQSVDARSDIYSAGVLLYQMLTGERPFEGGLTAIIHKALNTVPPRPSELSVTAPPALDAVVARAMSRRPGDRFPTAAGFARAMRQAFETGGGRAPGEDAGDGGDATRIISPRNPPAERPAATAFPAAARRPRAPLLAGAGATVLLLLAGGAWLALRPASNRAHPSVAATAEPPPSPPASATPAATPPVAVATPEPPAVPVPAATTPMPTPSPAAPPGPAAPPAPAEPVITAAAPPAVAAPAPAIAPPEAAEPPAGRTALALAIPNPAALRDSLANVARSAPCAVPRFSVSDEGRIVVSGLVGAGGPEGELREAVAAAARGSATAWEARAVDGPYCQALDIIRPIDQPGSPFLGLALRDDATSLKDHDPIAPVLKLPEFPSHLVVDYLSHDGSVTHLFPTAAERDRVFPAGGSLPLGDPKRGVGEVGPPFGTDIIIAVASSVPLFAHPTGGETVATYLPALQAGVEAARRRNARIAGRAIALETSAR